MALITNSLFMTDQTTSTIHSGSLLVSSQPSCFATMKCRPLFVTLLAGLNRDVTVQAPGGIRESCLPVDPNPIRACMLRDKIYWLCAHRFDTCHWSLLTGDVTLTAVGDLMAVIKAAVSSPRTHDFSVLASPLVGRHRLAVMAGIAVIGNSLAGMASILEANRS